MHQNTENTLEIFELEIVKSNTDLKILEQKKSIKLWTQWICLRLDIAEQRITELKRRLKDVIQNVAQKDEQ